MTLKQLKQGLMDYYTQAPEIAFKQFRDGVIYFAVGMMTVYMANTYMAPSLSQELIVLAGLVLTGVGFLIALLGEMRLLIGRLLRFGLRK